MGLGDRVPGTVGIELAGSLHVELRGLRIQGKVDQK
jgi:hypothetical protein